MIQLHEQGVFLVDGKPCDQGFEPKEEAKPTPQVKKLDGKEFLNQQPEGTDDDDADLPFWTN